MRFQGGGLGTKGAFHPVLGSVATVLAGDVFSEWQFAPLDREDLLADPLVFSGSWRQPPKELLRLFLAKSMTVTLGNLGLTYGDGEELEGTHLLRLAVDCDEDGCVIGEDDVRGEILDADSEAVSTFDDPSQFLTLTNFRARIGGFGYGVSFNRRSQLFLTGSEDGEEVLVADRTVPTEYVTDSPDPGDTYDFVFDAGVIGRETSQLTFTWGQSPVYFSEHQAWCLPASLEAFSQKISELEFTTPNSLYDFNIGGVRDAVDLFWADFRANNPGGEEPLEAKTQTVGTGAYSGTAPSELVDKGTLPTVSLSVADADLFDRFLGFELG